MSPQISAFITEQLKVATPSLGRHVVVIEDAALPETLLVFRQKTDPTAYCGASLDQKNVDDMQERVDAITQAFEGLLPFRDELMAKFVSQRAGRSEEFGVPTIEVLDADGVVMVTFYEKLETV